MQLNQNRSCKHFHNGEQLAIVQLNAMESNIDK